MTAPLTTGREADPTLDDIELLDTMMGALEVAPEVYQTTPYWKHYEELLLPYLREQGLRDFRRAKNSSGARVLGALGALDLIEPAVRLRRLDESRVLVGRLLRRIPGVPTLVDGVARWMVRDQVDLASWRRLRYEFARSVGREAGAAPLDALSASRVGNPEDAFEIDGRHYTSRILYYYMRYAYAARFADFDQLKVCVELGPGGGRQAEIIHKLHPRIALCLFDIPPQLYVCHQYLRAVFGDDVVPFETTETMTDLGDLEAGRIYLFGSWKFPLLDTAPVDLFWNAASFQEMEPDVVGNYLRYVDRSAAAVYLLQQMEGQRVAKRAGGRGVVAPTTLEDYRRGLPSFELRDMGPALRQDASVLGSYRDSFWARTAARA